MPVTNKEDKWERMGDELKKHWGIEAMTALGEAGGTASTLAHGKKQALASGVTEDKWERMSDELKKHWVSEAMTAVGEVAALAHGKKLALASGVTEDKWGKG